jgi:hypothetical protein
MMTEAVRGEPGPSWLSRAVSAWPALPARILNADLLAVPTAVLLPWSTTGVAIAAGCWVIALLAALDMRTLRRSLTRPVSVLPVVLFALALAGTLWSATGEVGARGEITNNRHNQTLNVAVQWGVVGVIALYAMWLAHLLLFRGNGMVNWIGLSVVVQNIFTSLFNSHLFDFHEGWMYVLGVGVAGGMVLGTKRKDG